MLRYFRHVSYFGIVTALPKTDSENERGGVRTVEFRLETDVNHFHHRFTGTQHALSADALTPFIYWCSSTCSSSCRNTHTPTHTPTLWRGKCAACVYFPEVMLSMPMNGKIYPECISKTKQRIEECGDL